MTRERVLSAERMYTQFCTRREPRPWFRCDSETTTSGMFSWLEETKGKGEKIIRRCEEERREKREERRRPKRLKTYPWRNNNRPTNLPSLSNSAVKKYTGCVISAAKQFDSTDSLAGSGSLLRATKDVKTLRRSALIELRSCKHKIRDLDVGLLDGEPVFLYTLFLPVCVRCSMSFVCTRKDKVPVWVKA